MNKLFSYIVLVRPANILTAISDILAGAAISGVLMTVVSFNDLINNLLLLVFSTIGLYGGGIVFNDVFDIEIDRKERPNRPLPSGKVPYRNAVVFGIMLLVLGIALASLVSVYSGIIAFFIAASALVYDKWGKHNSVLGPVNMGLCRGGNLLLGISILPISIESFWPIALIPILFIAAITLTSQKETSGNNRGSIIIALILDAIILVALLTLGAFEYLDLLVALPFLVLWSLMNMSSKLTAIIKNKPNYIQKAVKLGILSLIPLNATYVAGFAGLEYGIAVLLILPLSIVLARKFAVT